MACGRTIERAFALGLAILTLAFATFPVRSPVGKGDVTVDVSGGYARLVFAIRDDIDATARLAGNVLIVSFSKPTIAGIDRVAAQATDYIGAARRDPDGRAVRMGMARKVKVNSIRAGEKFFVDLLPDTWSGAPPGCRKMSSRSWPDARARPSGSSVSRARVRMAQEAAAGARACGSQPTFMRFVFDVPDQTAVTADRAKDRLTLTFDAPITFDLADAEASLPASVASINAEVEQDSDAGSFRLSLQGRCPHLPRRQELRCRCCLAPSRSRGHAERAWQSRPRTRPSKPARWKRIRAKGQRRAPSPQPRRGWQTSRWSQHRRPSPRSLRQ